MEEAQKLHLFLATRVHMPLESPRSKLRSQCMAQGKLLLEQPQLDQLLQPYVPERRGAPDLSPTAPDVFEPVW